PRTSSVFKLSPASKIKRFVWISVVCYTDLLAVDGAGAVYVADTDNNRVVQIGSASWRAVVAVGGVV
ncbi:hypothetical protein PJH48_29110, partial [Mycobacterium kansasii]